MNAVVRAPSTRFRLLSALAVAVAGCDGGAGAQWAGNLAPSTRDTLMQWLLCEDCRPGSRDAAGRPGDQVVPALAAVLAGPPDAWRRNMAGRYGRAARRISQSGTDSVRLVSEYLADFDATTQRRSAMVLGDIGSSGAVGVLREALDSALTRQYRRDVVRAIHEALATATLPPFGGRVSDSVPDFLDTVVVRAAPGLAWDGDESVALPGTPFGDSLLIQRWSDDSLSLVAVGEAGRYALSVGNIGPNQVAQRQRIHIRSFPAPPSDEVPEVAAAQLPLRLYLSLARGTQPADTSSFFRFRPLVDLPVTAAVEWTGPAQIDLSWEDCTERSFPGPPLRISGVVMDESGQPIGAAAVRLLGTAFAAVTDGFGRFSMDVPAGRTGDLRVERAGYQPAQRPAAEGRHYWVVLYQAAAPAPFPGQVISLASPGSSTITIPARSCRLLGLVQTDPAASAVIVRLRITSP